MKRSTPKSFKKKHNTQKKVAWFGIDVHHIALGVAFVGCVVAFLLVEQQKTLEQSQSQVLAAMNSSSAGFHWGANTTGIKIASPNPICIPQPPCLNATPRCEIAEPVGGWCPSGGTPTPSVVPPPGCFYGACPLMCSPGNSNCCKNYKHPLICPSGTPAPSLTPPSGCSYKTICSMIACRANGKCNNCRSVLICSSGIPHLSVTPRITCAPRPPCPTGRACPNLSQHSIWCSPQASSSSGIHPVIANAVHSGGVSLLVQWNNFLRKIFGFGL